MQVTIHRGHKAESLRETTLRARKQIIKQSVLDDASSDKCSRPISSEEISTVIAFISRADIEEAKVQCPTVSQQLSVLRLHVADD
ncbi:hypothetical protein C8035_v007652 [Colletotrichum spinosum]|uniref:Uncharacterized protein n=1 Tax=Colletotrichum spinosum TaxID=1347390 RepID=A0A4R8QFX2_9PEZI|nr:hypothetical protein C8035_v007652 [Colletotrichum spinosum]